MRSGEFLLRELLTGDGRLLRTCKNGEAKINGYLEDYANLMDGLLELYQTTYEERWFSAAIRLAERVLAHFPAADGGFFDTSDDHETLIVRPRNVQDNAVPSGNGMIARQLLRLAAYTGKARYEQAAVNTLRLLSEALRQFPQAFGESLSGVDMLVQGHQEVAVIGAADDERTQALLRVVTEAYRPNVITALNETDVEGEAIIPLLNYRVMRGGGPTVYVCRNFVCAMPVTTPDEMRRLLDVQPQSDAPSEGVLKL